MLQGVSKEHAIVEIEAGGTTLMDLDSRNGTRIGKVSPISNL